RWAVLVLPLPSRWLVSSTASRAYVTSAAGALGYLIAACSIAVFRPGGIHGSAVWLIRTSFVPLIGCWAILWVAMLYHCCREFYDSGSTTKALWQGAMLFIGGLASLPYYFFIYRRALRIAAAERAGGRHTASA